MKDIIKIINDNLDKLNKNISTTNLWEIGDCCKWSVEDHIIEPLTGFETILSKRYENYLIEPIEKLYKENWEFAHQLDDLLYCPHSKTNSFGIVLLEQINANLSNENKISIDDFNDCYKKDRINLVKTLEKIEAVDRLINKKFEYLGLKGKCFNDFSKKEETDNEK